MHPPDPADPLDPTLASIVREQTGFAWSKSRRLCVEGRVTVNGKRSLDPAMRVSPRMVVSVDQHAPKLRNQPLEPDAIVFADYDVVVVDKPAGMLSVADEPGNKETLVDYARTLLRQTGAVEVDTQLGVVHRLDKDTSGVMVFARTAHAKRELAAQFRDHSIERVYLAIAHGEVPATHADTHLILDRGDGMRGSHGHFRRTADEAPDDAKRAITYITPVASLHEATLVECRLETGRQHQIRIHLSELGHPLVGERVYIRDFRGRKIDAERTMLHARMLGFIHPRTGEKLRFERDAPEDFTRLVEKLERR